MQYASSIIPQSKYDSNISLMSNICDIETVSHYVIEII